MSEQSEFTLPKEIERALQIIFRNQSPNPAFIDRLGQHLSDQVRQYTAPRHRIQAFGSPLAWGAIALILILLLVWGIKTLIPSGLPAKVIEATPSPTALPSPVVSPTQVQPTLPTLLMENAVYYTVKEGDTLSAIEEKTGVPIETLKDLNPFVLQLDRLTPGLQLVTDFKGQTPIFYTVKEQDTIVSISSKAGISVEDFITLNFRDGRYILGIQTPNAIPQYMLTPGIQVIIGLDTRSINDNESISDKFLVLSEADLNCDGRLERISGIEAPEITYFNISPQLSSIQLEIENETGYEKVWEQSAQTAGVAYLAYQLFKADNCNQFLVVLAHKGKEGVKVYRWDGDKVTSVLNLSGRFLFEGSWMQDVFGDYKITTDTLFLGELKQPGNTSKNIWILRGYQWRDDRFKLITDKSVELNGGG